jgi:hypothetical protein
MCGEVNYIFFNHWAWHVIDNISVHKVDILNMCWSSQQFNDSISCRNKQNQFINELVLLCSMDIIKEINLKHKEKCSHKIIWGNWIYTHIELNLLLNNTLQFYLNTSAKQVTFVSG